MRKLSRAGMAVTGTIAAAVVALCVAGCSAVSTKNVKTPDSNAAVNAVTTAAVAKNSRTEQNTTCTSAVAYNETANTFTKQAQPAAQQIQYTEAAAQSAEAAVQSAAPQYQAASTAEQAAAQNALAYAGGNGWKIIGSEAVKTDNGKVVYCFTIVPTDNPNAPAWKFYAGEDFAMTEGEWINKQETITKEEWEDYYDSAEHRYAIAYQEAVQNAIAFSGIEDAMAESCEFVSFDYDKLQYAFKVAVRPINDKNAPLRYYIAGSDYAMDLADWTK